VCRERSTEELGDVVELDAALNVVLTLLLQLLDAIEVAHDEQLDHILFVDVRLARVQILPTVTKSEV
jgi:hypothetical protein